MTDASGNTWTWTYDVLGQQIAAHDPDAGDTAQRYDAAGRVATTAFVTMVSGYDNGCRPTETTADVRKPSGQRCVGYRQLTSTLQLSW